MGLKEWIVDTLGLDDNLGDYMAKKRDNDDEEEQEEEEESDESDFDTEDQVAGKKSRREVQPTEVFARKKQQNNPPELIKPKSRTKMVEPVEEEEEDPPQKPTSPEFTKYFNEVLVKLPITAVGLTAVARDVNGTNFVVIYDKLGRPQHALQIDTVDLDALGEAIGK